MPKRSQLVSVASVDGSGTNRHVTAHACTRQRFSRRRRRRRSLERRWRAISASRPAVTDRTRTRRAHALVQAGAMDIEQRLNDRGVSLPAPVALPAGIEIPFAWVRVRKDRAYVSGHGALDENGTPTGPFGRIPGQVSLGEAQHSACLAVLAILAGLKGALGDLDRVSAWLTLSGYVQAEAGYSQTTAVMNPCSELILDLYGPEAGMHARSAIGVAALPLNLPVVISAEVEIDPQ